MLKIFKTIISSILNLILLMAITTICAIYVSREFLSGENLINILNKSTINSFDYNTLIPSKDNQNIEEYIDQEKINEELGNLITDYLKYSSGIPNSEAPSTDELKELIKNSSLKYEEKTGQKIDTDEINKQLDEVELKLKEENEITKNVLYQRSFKFIYNDYYIYLSITIALICIILILIINKIENLIKHLIGVALFNGIGNVAFGIALRKIIDMKKYNIAKETIALLTKSFNKIAIISFVIAGLLLVLYITIKIIKNIINRNSKSTEVTITSLDSNTEENI